MADGVELVLCVAGVKRDFAPGIGAAASLTV
jgi:hypothetical protein